MNMKHFLKNTILKNFFSVALTSHEKTIAHEAVIYKYEKALKNWLISGVLFILPVFYFDTNVIVSVLIPITMVAGTAWFSISLANMKKKFDTFWLELTTNLFEAFSISLALLFVIASSSVIRELDVTLHVPLVETSNLLKIFAAWITIVIMWNIIYKIFIWSMKYDINDSMLGWQNEVAERYYRKSLSLLHNLSDSLRLPNWREVANYNLWVAFYEIFTFIQQLNLQNQNIDNYLRTANSLIKKPNISIWSADLIGIELVEAFLSMLDISRKDEDLQKSIKAITDELTCLQTNNEWQELTDTRFWVIFVEIASILELNGELAFKKSWQKLWTKK